MKANIRHDTRNKLPEIKIPTLILVGKDDELTPFKMAEELSSEIPGSELKVLDRGGHGLYWEIPDLFNREVLEFVNARVE